MGLFSKDDARKKSPATQAKEFEEQFLEENFREELRAHGRAYFEKLIDKDGLLFKRELDATTAAVEVELKEHVIKQLDATVAQVNAELKEHVLKRLDERFMEYGTEMKNAQNATLESLKRSAQTLQDQQHVLNATIEKNITNQQAMLTKTSDENTARIAAMKNSQDLGLQALNRTTEALQDQYQQLTINLQKSITDQQAVMVTIFQENMAQIIEHYLLGALGEQYDLKAQLPSIIKQMEANKQAIADDMKL